MRGRGAGSVLVIDDQQRLSGIFTGRDAVCTLAEGKDAAVTSLATGRGRPPVGMHPLMTRPGIGVPFAVARVDVDAPPSS
jgi:CBS domain-containing protein